MSPDNKSPSSREQLRIIIVISTAIFILSFVGAGFLLNPFFGLMCIACAAFMVAWASAQTLKESKEEDEEE